MKRFKFNSDFNFIFYVLFTHCIFHQTHCLFNLFKLIDNIKIIISNIIEASYYLFVFIEQSQCIFEHFNNT